MLGEVPAGAQLEAMVNVHGQGRCAITLDPKDKSSRPAALPRRVVPLHGDQREPLQQVQQVLEHYMLQSEQLDTRLILAADDQVAAGLLIQRLPVEGEGNLERAGATRTTSACPKHFNRIALLAATLTRDELLALEPRADPAPAVLGGDGACLRAAAAPRFACTCSAASACATCCAAWAAKRARA